METEPAPEVTEAKPRRSELEEGIKLDNRYRLITIIEKGGMGAVYKAMDTRLDNICAIKEMRENFERDEYRIYAIEKFKSEALILSKLRHPNIPRVFDYFIEKDRYYLAMDYIEGQTLFRVMHKRKDKRLEEEELVEWTLQLCDVLAYLHNQDPPIIYRDIKPANIMINSEKRIMLIDFGIARIFNPKSKGTMIGTQGYSPPEQYRGQVDPRSDIYALGATLHHLITGKDPQLDAPFSFPPVRELREELSDRLSYAIDKCLKFNMEDRFSCVEELRDHLENRSPVNIEVEKPPQPEPEEEIPAPPEEKKEKKSGILASELENLLFSIEEASTTITNRTPPVSQESTEKTQEKPVKKPVFEPGEPEEEIPIPREVSATELTIPEKTRPEPKPEPVKKPKPKPRKKSLLDDLSLGGISFNELKEEEEEEDPFDLLQVEDDGRDSQLFDEL
ncbi:MAG: serine/threonine protein kinase, partial [Vulcanimicrobiota bacterium]